MDEFGEIIILAPGIWLFGPKLVQLSKTLFVLLEYGYLVPDGCNHQNHSSCSWNMVIWSQMDEFVEILIHAPGMWLFGPIWVQLAKALFVLLEYGYLVPNGCSAIIKITVHAPGMWLFWSLMGAIIEIIVHAPGTWLYGPKWV